MTSVRGRGLVIMSATERRAIRSVVDLLGLDAAAGVFCVHPSTLTKALSGLPIRKSIARCLRAAIEEPRA